MAQQRLYSRADSGDSCEQIKPAGIAGVPNAMVAATVVVIWLSPNSLSTIAYSTYGCIGTCTRHVARRGTLSTLEPTSNFGASRLGLSWSIEDHDQYGSVTVVAVLGVIAAFAMAAFGLPPVDFHGPLHYIGIMDPFCGGTRAARYAAAGNLQMAWKYNPLGIVAVAGGAAVVARSLVGLTTRRWVTPTIHWTKKGRRTVLIITAVLLIVLEVCQQLLAQMLLVGR